MVPQPPFLFHQVAQYICQNGLFIFFSWWKRIELDGTVERWKIYLQDFFGTSRNLSIKRSVARRHLKKSSSTKMKKCEGEYCKIRKNINFLVTLSSYFILKMVFNQWRWIEKYWQRKKYISFLYVFVQREICDWMFFCAATTVLVFIYRTQKKVTKRILPYFSLLKVLLYYFEKSCRVLKSIYFLL